MAYKQYNFQLFLRLFILLVIAIAIGLLIGYKASNLLITILVLIEVLALINFIKFLNNTNQQIDYFIQAIKNEDTTLRFPVLTGNAIINELHKSLNELNVILQEAKVKSQIRERYFGEILQNIATGVIVITEHGFITDVNTAALELFGLQNLTHLSQIGRVDHSFEEEIAKAENRQKKMLVLNRKNEKIQVITRCSVISLKNEDVTLITLQDIRGELERKEIDSWVKLIRVLSHEIMNSLTPVTSIAQSLKSIWKEKVQANASIADDGDVESTIGGLDVIGERGEALIRFVQSYRILTRVPQPKIKEIRTEALVDSLNILVSPMKDGANTSIEFHQLPEDILLKTDEQMLVQVILNLVKNSIESFKNKTQGKVDIYLKLDKKRHFIIEVVDNGPGIPEAIKDEIFVPFFTTKDSGTGVGLSYSRQIIRALGGTIQCNSVPGNTVFTIELQVR